MGWRQCSSVCTRGDNHMENRIEVKATRPRLTHEYGDGYVLSVTAQDTDPADLAALLKGLQSGYIKVTLER